MITPKAAYRVNRHRSVHISGVIDRDLLSRLTPEILKLQSENRAPITVFIDSPGGNIASMEAILRLLRLSDQDSSDPCRIITAVTNQAASAAADLLSSGDYAVAYPTSSLLYHGVRPQAESLPPLTVERTSYLGHMLRQTNDRYAMELARKIEERFTFRFMMARNEFDALRTEAGKPLWTDLDCFYEYVERRLSFNAREVWVRTRQRHDRYKSLFETILKKTAGGEGPLSRARLEASRIKAIVDFEVRANKRNATWSFTDGGLDNLADDFFLLNEYLSSTGKERLRTWSMQFGRFVLPHDEIAAIDAIADPEEQAKQLVEKVAPILEPVSSFFVAFCYALQSGENELTAYDAYWLGLVDEVFGENLFSIRTLVEYTPDPPVAAPPALVGN